MSQDFIYRMQQYETTAPLGVWDSIVEKLDEADEYTSFSNRLQQYEVSPPANAWQNIEALIDDNYSLKKTTPVRSIFSLPRIAVAAAFIGLIATSIWYFNIPVNSASTFLQNTFSSAKVDKKQPPENRSNSSVNNATDARYITVISPSGSTTHISSKLNKAVKFMGNNTSSTPSANTTEERIWKEKITRWRTKILNSNYAPGSGNFLDIIELQQLVDEK